jgi:hypothetical protein
MGTEGLTALAARRQHPQRPPPGAWLSIREHRQHRQPNAALVHHRGGDIKLPRWAKLLQREVTGGSRVVRRGRGREERGEDVADADAVDQLMSQSAVEIDSIAITTAVLKSLEIAGMYELGHQGRRGAFGYSYGACNIPKTQCWVAGQTYQHVGVVRKKRPRPPLFKFLHGENVYR